MCFSAKPLYAGFNEVSHALLRNISTTCYHAHLPSKYQSNIVVRYRCDSRVWFHLLCEFQSMLSPLESVVVPFLRVSGRWDVMKGTEDRLHTHVCVARALDAQF